MQCPERLFLGMTLSVVGRQRPVPSFGGLSYRKKAPEEKSGPLNLLEILSLSSLSVGVFMGLGVTGEYIEHGSKSQYLRGYVKNI